MPKEKHGPLIDLRNELNNLMIQVNQLGNEALNEASDMLKNRLEQNTPVNTGRTKENWFNENKYNLVKYLWNSELSPSGIPVVNLLEFSSKGKPFAIRTFRDCMDEISEKIVNKLNEIK